MLAGTEEHHGASRRIEVRGEEDYTAKVEEFKRDRGIGFVLAFSGGADDENPLLQHISEQLQLLARTDDERELLKKQVESAVDDYIATIVRAILKPLRGYRIAVQSGGTKWGVPRIAIEVARECGFPTIGVYPQLAEQKHALREKLDLSVCVHPQIYQSSWGDEASVFTKLLDGVVVIGGNAGTLVEMAKILKLNERKGIAIKHIVPIYGTGGAANSMLSFPGKLKTMAACLPAHRITTGREAVEYLKDSVVPEDIYKRFDEKESM